MAHYGSPFDADVKNGRLLFIFYKEYIIDI